MSEYEAINWDNHDRPLTPEELHEIEQRVAGIHFSKEAIVNDKIALQGLYLAEALLRHIRYLPTAENE